MEPQHEQPAADQPLPNPHAKSFTEIIREIDRGKVYPELEEQLQKVVKAAQRTQKKGKLKLTIDVKPAGENQLMLKASVDATIPKPDPNPTLYFTDDHAQLMRRDPKQYEMDLATPKPIRPREDRPGQ